MMRESPLPTTTSPCSTSSHGAGAPPPAVSACFPRGAYGVVVHPAVSHYYDRSRSEIFDVDQIVRLAPKMFLGCLRTP